MFGQARVRQNCLFQKGPSKAKSFVPKGPNKPILIVQGAHIPPVIIRPVSQLPMTNPKAVPWNYEPTVVTYKEMKLMKK